MMDHLTHENFRVDLPRAEREKMPRERYRKWMKLKERQGWDSGKISGIFSRKYVEKQKRERRVASIFGFLRVASNFRLPIASV